MVLYEYSELTQYLLSISEADSVTPHAENEKAMFMDIKNWMVKCPVGGAASEAAGDQSIAGGDDADVVQAVDALRVETSDDDNASHADSQGGAGTRLASSEKVVPDSDTSAASIVDTDVASAGILVLEPSSASSADVHLIKHALDLCVELPVGAHTTTPVFHLVQPTHASLSPELNAVAWCHETLEEGLEEMMDRVVCARDDAALEPAHVGRPTAVYGATDNDSVCIVCADAIEPCESLVVQSELSWDELSLAIDFFAGFASAPALNSQEDPVPDEEACWQVDHRHMN
jgi:hypothetical protein